MRRGPFTIIDSGRVSKVDATLSHDTVWLSFNALKTALGWEHKPEGLCRGDVCVPVSEEVDVISDEGVDLVAFAERFGREARTLARLSHPRIVGIHDFGEAEGLYYFVMEHVDGANLREVLRAGQLSPEEALALVPQICEALQYAHEEGVVTHRPGEEG